ncbi:UNVERIFIED_CONTAM: hypothetical protein Scaly_2738900 [Sesamum calycinum]|uniref:Integrase catalytic domain-containing protein n=1 Tax=Sesamum calycinum TaxID=2727403 RepID=A0AAW2J0H7_9LAMI
MALLYVGNGWPYLPPMGIVFLIFAISYLTKWVEAVSYSSLTKKVMQKFLNKERICRYGLPERIITDNANAQNLNSARISLQAAEDPASNSAPYRPQQMNGAVEAEKKKIKNKNIFRNSNYIQGLA